MASSTKQLITSTQKIVLNSTTEVIDSFPFTSWTGVVEYTLIFETTIGARLKTLKLVAEKKGVGVEDQIYNRAGSVITLQVTAQVTGLNFELAITNNDIVPIKVTLIRIKQ